MGDDNTTGVATLTTTERQTLRTVVGMMIPSSEAYDVPGADDPAIFDRILHAAESDDPPIATALQTFEETSRARHHRSFADLDGTQRSAIVDALAQSNAEDLRALETITAQAYYSDDRVMRALGMEVRPPFPQGYTVEPGDWSLLDPVRQRSRLYRDV